ncbi:MAG TPA: Ig-like domain-containing protein, partial [Anaerovoracaceae bacterium]|nr:Ig-like domain-containing protein [Anaerovoracaceae bacterium]
QNRLSNVVVTADDGSTITNSELPGIVTIRKGSTGGSAVAYTGSINSAKTVMTLTPSTPLLEDTRYYIVVKAGTMIDADGEENEAMTSYFNTGSDTEKLLVTYVPVHGETAVAADRKSFTISFSEGLTKYNGTSLSTGDSYLKSSVILFRRGSTNVGVSDYTVSINSARTRITITLDDDYDLTLNTNYTIGVKASTLKTTDGEAVPASNATWKTAGLPVLSSVGVVAGETSVTFKATPNVSGRIYAVLLPVDAAAPTAARIRDGKDAADAAAIAAVNAATPASGAATLPLTGEGITRDTAYKVYAVLYDGSGNASQVVSTPATTEPLKLKSLTVVPDTGTGDILTGFKPETLDYGTIVVPNGTSYVEVTAEANALSFVGDLTINDDTQIADKQIDLTAGSAEISVVVQELGKRS